MNELFQGMQFSARPSHTANVVSASSETVDSCDRDYSAGCPSGFESENGSCVATQAYNGPCAGEAHNFSGFSTAMLSRWQAQCGAFFPCKQCTRDYSAACPMGFASSGGKCVPTAAYGGPCGEADFSEYNAAMLKAWSMW